MDCKASPLPEREHMKIDVERFRVRPGEKVNLSKWSTTVKPYWDTEEDYKATLGKDRERLASLQEVHWASNQYALLLIFQGMDTAGKDGAIGHVMSGVNPEGCEVSSFKQPSVQE